MFRVDFDKKVHFVNIFLFFFCFVFEKAFCVMDINTEHVKSSDRIWTLQIQTSAGKSIIEESVVSLQFGRTVQL